MKIENGGGGNHASTNTHSADRVSRKTIGLHTFTPYIYQYAMASSRQSQHNGPNIGPS